jgi:hypothetical protein
MLSRFSYAAACVLGTDHNSMVSFIPIIFNDVVLTTEVSSVRREDGYGFQWILKKMGYIVSIFKVKWLNKTTKRFGPNVRSPHWV